MGLDKIIEKRTQSASIGFGANIKTSNEKSTNELLKVLEVDDVIKYGHRRSFGNFN